ncbi:MAG: DUF4350 domain-containing protein [Cryobacterium sp.]|nr:DUF4350 domain-containing protein [Cryobacterium sp.]MBX3089327.1 DUF4350 domain-containing protein [Cryobacterium sp.]MCO5294590.1 DUF4350 domain-containing protein [Homoserinimonas sp.]
MSTIETAATKAPEETPTVRARLRRARFWILIALALLLIIGIAFIILKPSSAGLALSASDPSPNGAKALAEVLKQQGVEVTIADSMDEVRDSPAPIQQTTIFLYDPSSFLNDSKLLELARYSSVLVIMEPTFSQLLALAPEVAQAGPTKGTASAGCDYRPATQADQIATDGTAFRMIEAAPGAEACFDSGTGTDEKSVIVLDRDSKSLVIVGTHDAFSNGAIDQLGNAALALGVLGSKDNLIWFMPTIREADAGALSLVDLTPAWVTPLLSFALIVFVAAAIWRGRRLGSLVVENLPVVVPASETMEGRARLYAAGSARLRALDALRVGTVARISQYCGLPRSATVNEVINAAARLTNRPVSELEALLINSEPAGDAEFVSYSDRLLSLENAVKKALLPGDLTPSDPNKGKQE